MNRTALVVTLISVAVALVVAFRDALRNTMISSINRGKVSLDRTGNRTNDIPSRRGELPTDLR
jgi:hypothetical protein